MNSTVVRSVSGVVFLAIMVGSMLLSPIAFAIVMSIAIALMMTEYLMLSIDKGYDTTRALSIISGVMLYIFIFLYKGYGMNPKWFYLLTIPVSLIFVSLLYYKDLRIGHTDENEQYNKHPYLLAALIYIAQPFALTSFILFDSDQNYKPFLLLSLFIIAWSSDVGAYIFGMLFGQKDGHKLFPSISPKKSWEGFFGGLFCGILAGSIIWLCSLTELTFIHSLALSLIVSLSGVAGDLVESQFKRNFGVKDSGKLIPGHGGLLDRFDGILISFPLAIAYIKIFSII